MNSLFAFNFKIKNMENVYFMSVIVSFLFMLAASKTERHDNILGDWQDFHYSVRRWYHVRRYREYVMLIVCFIPYINFISACTIYILTIIFRNSK